ncbi:MAG: hypothetical protein KKD44_25990 [Proteobacteria bacterium]|nr:hypothetical protein [Pseudomonadota bacterium]
MKVTNGEVRLMRDALQKLIALKMPVSLSLKLAKLANKVNVDFQDMELVRISLVNQYGIKDENGNMSVDLAPVEERNKFWSEFVSLLNQEVEIDAEPIVLSIPLDVEPSVLMPLLKFLKE